MNFIFIAQYIIHDEKILKYMKQVIYQINYFKWAFVNYQLINKKIRNLILIFLNCIQSHIMLIKSDYLKVLLKWIQLILKLHTNILWKHFLIRLINRKMNLNNKYYFIIHNSLIFLLWEMFWIIVWVKVSYKQKKMIELKWQNFLNYWIFSNDI